MDKKVKYLILGAGPTGLAAAHRLMEAGEDSFLILEKDVKAGGLCRSYRTPEGFAFDTAGHIVFSKRQRFYDFLQKIGIPLKKHKRNVYIWLFDRWIPYPLQNNVGYFPTDKAVAALTELAEIGFKGQGWVDRSTFAKYMTTAFGPTIAENFLYPYNKKVWSTAPELMSTDWMGDRVSAADFKSILTAVLEKKAIDDWGPNNIFFYPETGAFEDIFTRMVEMIPKDKIQYSQDVVRVEADQKFVSTQEGGFYQYDQLISTIPLDELMNKVWIGGSQNRDLSKISGDLRHNTIVGVGIGYKPNRFNEELEKRQPVCWLYFPHPKIPFYRITQLSNYSSQGAPQGARSWLVELSFDSKMTPEEIKSRVDEVIPTLKSLNLLFDEDEILCFDWHTHSYGYPVPTLERDRVLKEVSPKLESMGIYARGRHGDFHYETGNTDHSMLKGFEIVERLLNGTPEVVLHQTW